MGCYETTWMKQRGFHRWNKIHRVERIDWMSDEDWVYFKSRWNDYKKATGITGDDIITQLALYCLTHMMVRGLEEDPK